MYVELELNYVVEYTPDRAVEATILLYDLF